KLEGVAIAVEALTDTLPWTAIGKTGEPYVATTGASCRGTGRLHDEQEAPLSVVVAIQRSHLKVESGSEVADRRGRHHRKGTGNLIGGTGQSQPLFAIHRHQLCLAVQLHLAGNRGISEIQINDVARCRSGTCRRHYENGRTDSSAPPHGVIPPSFVHLLPLHVPKGSG